MSTDPVLMHAALDATDVRALAEFYSELLGLQYRPGDEPSADGSADDEDWLVLIDGDGNRKLAFQEVPVAHVAPGEPIRRAARCGCAGPHAGDGRLDGRPRVW